MKQQRVSTVFFVACALGIQATIAPRGSIPFQHRIVDNDYPKQPHCKTVGDIDGDGFIDVLAASAGGEGLYWYAYPRWAKYRIDEGSFTTDMQVGDVDRDGDLDVIIPKGATVLWYENPRPASRADRDAWKSHAIAQVKGHDIEVGDIDGDGDLDVVAREGATAVLLQDTPTRWTTVILNTGGRGGTALADLDRDGDLDIVQNGYWLEAPEDKVKEPWPRHNFGGAWPDDVGATVADLNRDARPDILLAPAESKGRLCWYEAPADPRSSDWKEHLIDADVTHIHTFKVADMDNDGDLDVVTAEMEQSPLRRVSVHRNGGDSLDWMRHVVATTGSHNLRVADIGRDGDFDIIGANHGNYGGPTPVEFWENRTADARQ